MITFISLVYLVFLSTIKFIQKTLDIEEKIAHEKSLDAIKLKYKNS